MDVAEAKLRKKQKREIKKMVKIKEVIRDSILLIVIIALIIIFKNFIINNLKILGAPLFILCINWGIVLFHEKKYGQKNFPYKPYKSKKKIGERILIGLLAGFHYTFFIGNYNHKKYNTQVEYPETIECVFGNISQLIIFIGYLFISVKLFEIIKYYSLLFMIIPIITNIISLKLK